MKITVVGKKIGSFLDENGIEIKYAKLYVLTDPPSEDGVIYEGRVPDFYSISQNLADAVEIGSDVSLVVNSKGKIIAVESL